MKASLGPHGATLLQFDRNGLLCYCLVSPQGFPLPLNQGQEPPVPQAGPGHVHDMWRVARGDNVQCFVDKNSIKFES